MSKIVSLGDAGWKKRIVPAPEQVARYESRLKVLRFAAD